jgi:hypothetical protein
MNYESLKEYEKLTNLGLSHDYAFMLACKAGGQEDLAEGKKRDIQREQDEIREQLVQREFVDLNNVIPLLEDQSLNYVQPMEMIDSLHDMTRYDPTLPFDPNCLRTQNVVSCLEDENHVHDRISIIDEVIVRVEESNIKFSDTL